MLTDIYLKNFTIVKQLHLTLNHGLSVLSGETGAGKSIVIDAVNLCLGARADYQLIRHGEKQCEISLSFDLQHIPSAQQWLETHDFSDENECVIARTLQSEGRSRSSINGKPCSSNQVRELATHLIVIHGQHQSQSLLQRDAQQRYVDSYGKHENLLTTIQQLYQQWRERENQLQTLRQLADERESQLDFLRHQLNELDALNLQKNEWESLHEEHQRLHNSEQLISSLTQALEWTIENDTTSASSQIQKAIKTLEKINLKEKAITTALELLNTSTIHLQEAVDELNDYYQSLDTRPERLAMVEQRLMQLNDMARKHRVEPCELIKITQELQTKIQQLENSDDLIEELTQKQQALLNEYSRLAAQLTKLRKAAAKKIDEKITAYMQQLGMEGGEFQIEWEQQTQTISPTGNEKLQFYVKTNPGQALQPLTKVVSGGELSRISLALQTIIAQKDNIPTFIFDEIDVGIGGKTAEMVGKLLRELGKITQVYCITHLPQVAAQGNYHYRVSKSSTAQETCTAIHLLTQEERVHELARMISGSKITEQTLAHAESLLTD